ncbi:hypothetical protein [Luteimicrobium subarcticum]|uniref:Uncharacterized protein n=1 Tax=Luteimicrobium subarcticum TaxID=620910 RepID=A0A2M8WW43_9MICO|nr:hypothetical protein [Luteimicrobium subarcticum]PJI95133.1 hypothetical protein CLV34_0987 [Luteimicrobium subarcticum]
MTVSPALLDATRMLQMEPRGPRWRSITYCVVDAVWSIGINYDRHVVPAVRRVASNAGDSDPLVLPGVAAPDPFPLDAFLAAYPTTDALVSQTTRHRTSSRGGILKADAALRFAGVLVDSGITTLKDTVPALDDPERVDAISARLRAIPGDGVRTGYFWMTAGDDQTVKPDRMILSFLSRYGGPDDVAGARVALAELATALSTPEHPVTPWMVDHAIWNAERRRRR